MKGMWTVTAQVPGGKLEQFMAATIGPWDITLGAWTPARQNGLTKPRITQSVGADEALTMTDAPFPPRKGTARDKCLKLFERLEAKHGIGNITRGYLQQEMAHKKFTNPGQTVTTMLRNGWLASLEPGGIDAATHNR